MPATAERKPKVKRCEYRHDWKRGTWAADVKTSEPAPIVCGKCGYTPQRDSGPYKEAEAILHLREVLKPGDTVYTVLRHVSRSGMSRGIDVYYMSDLDPIWITGYVGHAIGTPQPYEYWRKSMGLKVGGCGMDMGFHVVNSLSYVIFPEYKCLGKSDDVRCPSSYHTNHRNTVQCDGIGTGDEWQPCHRSDTVTLPDLQVKGVVISQGKAYTVQQNGIEVVCPTCKGHGRYPNPKGPEQFDLVHKDGYALRHKWL